MRAQNSLIRFALLAVTIFGMSVEAVAGPGGSGGGDAVKNAAGQWSLLDLNESLPYDYFVPTSLNGDTYNKLNEAEETLNLCSYHIPLDAAVPDYNRPQLGKAVDWLEQRQSFGYSFLAYHFWPDKWDRFVGKQLVWIGTETPLENIKDEGVIRLTDISSKQQVAAQKDGVVMVYMPIFRAMDAESQAGLMVHESLLRIVLKVNPNSYAKYGTAPIRELVNVVFNKDFKQLPQPTRDRVCGPSSDLFR